MFAIIRFCCIEVFFPYIFLLLGPGKSFAIPRTSLYRVSTVFRQLDVVKSKA